MSRHLSKLLLWLLLAIPAGLMVSRLTTGAALPMDLLHPSGEMAVRLMVLAMLPGPLAEFFGANRFLGGWLAIRRNLGVGAFAYALLHLVLYIVDMGALAAILDELELPSILTGWLALAAMIPPAAVSFDRAMRELGRRWQRVQYFVYPALLLSLLHWLLLDWQWQPAAIHLLPLIIAWSLRAIARRRRRPAKGNFE